MGERLLDAVHDRARVIAGFHDRVRLVILEPVGALRSNSPSRELREGQGVVHATASLSGLWARTAPRLGVNMSQDDRPFGRGELQSMSIKNHREFATAGNRLRASGDRRFPEPRARRIPESREVSRFDPPGVTAVESSPGVTPSEIDRLTLERPPRAAFPHPQANSTARSVEETIPT